MKPPRSGIIGRWQPETPRRARPVGAPAMLLTLACGVALACGIYWWRTHEAGRALEPRVWLSEPKVSVK